LLFLPFGSCQIIIYLSQQTTCSPVCDGTSSNPFSNLTAAHDYAYSLLSVNPSYTNVSFQFLGNNFTQNASARLYYFLNWENNLSRDLEIVIQPNASQNFTLFLNLQNLTFYATTNFTIANINMNMTGSFQGTLLRAKISRALDSNRALFEIWNNLTNFTMINSGLINLYSLASIDYYDYFIRVQSQVNYLTFALINSSFQNFYLRISFLQISGMNNTILINNSSFINYNNYNYIENLTNQTFSYIISSDNSLNGIANFNNLTMISCQILNSQFVLLSYLSFNYFFNTIFSIKFRTTTTSNFAGMSGVISVGSLFQIIFNNCSFLQGTTPLANITGINRAAIVMTLDLTNLSLTNCVFSNLTLREARIFLVGSYSTVVSTNTSFINLFHQCYEPTASNCQYYLFDFMSYNVINFTNCSFSNVTVQADNSLMRFFTMNNILMLNSSFSNFALLLNSGIYLIYVYSRNNFNIVNVFFLNYTAGFTAGLMYFDNNNYVHLNSSIFNANNIATNSGQVVYLSSTNQLFLFGTTITNLYSVYRNNVWVLTKNYVYYENCYVYNVTGARGGLSSIANNFNTYIVNLTVMVLTQCLNQGSVLYVIISNNYIQISSCIILNAFSAEDGAVFYIESFHTFVLQNTLVAYTFSNMFGGVLAGYASNIFSLTNLTAIQTQSLSNGGVFSLLQSNKLQLNNSIFYGCSSQMSVGGVLYSFLLNNVVFDRVNFINNGAQQDGGSFVIDDSNVFNLTNSMIDGSFTKGGDGGFLLIEQNNSVGVINCTIQNTFSAINAGFLKALQLNNITLTSNIFQNITSLQDGGVFYLESNNRFHLQNCSVVNASGTTGGLIYSSNNNSIFFKNSNISEITVSLQAGGIYADQINNISIVNCTFEDILNMRGNGGLFYLNSNNQLKFSSNIMKNLRTNNLGGILYGDQNNSINFTENNFNVISGQSFFYLGQLNFLNLTNMNVTNLFYYGFLSADTMNFIEIFQVSFLNTNSSYSDFLIAFNDGNSGNITSSNFTLMNSLISAIDFISLTTANNLFINDSLLIFDKCDQLFFVGGGSSLHIISFELSDFYSETDSLIDIENSNFTAEMIYLRNLKMLLFLNAYNSSIILFDFLYDLSIETTSFILAVNTNLSMKKGTISRKKLSNSTQVMGFVGSSILFNKVDIYGWQFQESGGMATLINSSVSFVKSTILMNKSWKNAGLFSIIYSNESLIQNNSDIYRVSMRQTIFLQNKAFGNGSVFLIDNHYLTYEIYINRSIFQYNKAQRGGALYSVNFQNIVVNNSKFSDNTASEISSSLLSKGGAFYFLNNRTFSDDENNPNINLTHSNFTNNQADIGGFLYMEGLNLGSLFRSKNLFYTNLANFYGDNFASETYSLRFFSLEKSQLAPFYEDQYTLFKLVNVKSGAIYPNCLLQMNGYDRFGSITYETDENLLNYFQISQLNPIFQGNTFSFQITDQGFICLISPITRNELPLETAFLYRFSPLPPLNLDQSFTFYVTFKTCDIGDYLNQANECVPCEKNSYSFITDFSTYSELCKTCVNQDFNCFGGGNYTPKPGFWRVSDQSPLFYTCLNQNACLGDPRDLSQEENSEYLEIFATGVCAEGYTNTLCALCEDGYGITSGNICVSCEDQSYYWNVFGNLVMRILFALYLINIAINMCISLMNDKPILSRIAATNLLKILTNHMQILGIILNLPLNISNNIVGGLGFLLSVSPNIGEAFSIQCVLKMMNVLISLAYFKLITSGFYPFVIVLFYLVFLNFMKCIRSKMTSSITSSTRMSNNITTLLLKNSLKYKDVMFTVFSLVCLTCYADISNMALAMFGCVDISDGTTVKSLLFSDLSIDCNGHYHQLWVKQLCIPIIIFFLVVYPGYIVFQIWLNLKNQKEKEENKDEKPIEYNGQFYFKYGYFFYAYRRKLFFWDFIILVRKLLLIFVNHYFFSRVTNTVSYSPIILMLLIITVAFIAQIYCKPFHKPTFHFINHVEEASLIISFFTVILILILISGEISDLFAFILLMIGMILNIWFFLWWFKKYYDYFFKHKLMDLLKIFPFVKNQTGKSEEIPRNERGTKKSAMSLKVIQKKGGNKIIVEKVHTNAIPQIKFDSVVKSTVKSGNDNLNIVDMSYD